jgi:hypothetical protein
MGGADKDKEKLYQLLLTAKEESVVAEFKEFAKKEVSKSLCPCI